MHVYTPTHTYTLHTYLPDGVADTIETAKGSGFSSPERRMATEHMGGGVTAYFKCVRSTRDPSKTAQVHQLSLVSPGDT